MMDNIICLNLIFKIKIKFVLSEKKVFYCMSISQLVYSFVDGYFDHSHLLSTINSARININTQIFQSLLSVPLGM